MGRLDDLQLKEQFKRLVRYDHALWRVNFTCGQFVIGTMHYQVLAGYADLNRLHFSVDSSVIPKDAAAIYNPQSNTITTRESRLQYTFQKIDVVHEATHAVIDLMGGLNKLTVIGLENETCAYLAGAMYALAIQQAHPSNVKITTPSTTKNIKDAADNIVRKKGLGSGATNAGNPISFSPADIAPLQAAIKANPLYKRDWAKVDLTDGM